MDVVVIGSGLVGRRSAQWLRRHGHEVRVMSGRRSTPTEIDRALGPAAVAVLATPSSTQPALAARALDQEASVVATADNPRAVRALGRLQAAAVAADRQVIVGASFAPGISSLLAVALGLAFDRVDTVTTARFGTGGPACAREHHRSMAASGWEIRDGIGRWVRGGSGRSLVWFPEPVGPQDCYRAGLAEPRLLHALFPGARRIQALQAATRRDRLTARLPMLRPPHPEGLLGATWAEVRGTVEGRIEHRVVAAVAPQATGAAAMAAVAADHLIRSLTATASGAESAGVRFAGGLPGAPNLLAAMSSDVRLFSYDGSVADAGEPSVPVRAARKRVLPLKQPPRSR